MELLVLVLVEMDRRDKTYSMYQTQHHKTLIIIYIKKSAIFC